jgi:hypothetical protein
MMFKFKFIKMMFIAVHSLSLISVFHPSIRGAIKHAIKGSDRNILSSVRAKLDNSDSEFNILKVRSENNLFLEIYSTDSSGSISLVEKFQLPDNHDAYFNFGGVMSNLVVAGIEQNGQSQIVVPSFDKDLVGHLNIFQFDSSSHSLIKATR